jgi:hypothetical protein
VNAGFLISPMLVGLSLLGAVVVAVILAFRKGPKRATIAGGLVAAVLLLLLLVTLASVLSRPRATEVVGEQMARNMQAQMKMMARDPLFESCPDSATALSEAEDCAAESSSTSFGADATTDRQRAPSRDRSTRIEVTRQGSYGSSTEATIEYRSDDDANPSAGTKGEYDPRVGIHRYDSDRPLLSRPVAYAAGAGAVSLLILLAYLFVDARPHGRHAWLRRGIWATAFVAVCLLLLRAGPLVR